MMIEVLLFGPERDAAGVDRVRVEIDGELTCAALRAALGTGTPALLPVLRCARFAVNGRFADDAHRIGAGDEVALIGLVSGG
ncbi:MAG: MoaD/ThiS family protein [Phycisphaerae bacterium]|nr:MoaD/ThiS family protein [Phycisphaerae bacterium]